MDFQSIYIENMLTGIFFFFFKKVCLPVFLTEINILQCWWNFSIDYSWWSSGIDTTEMWDVTSMVLQQSITYISPSLSLFQSASRPWLCRFWPTAARERKPVSSELPQESLEIRVMLAPGSTSASSTPVVSPQETNTHGLVFACHQGVMFANLSAALLPIMLEPSFRMRGTKMGSAVVAEIWLSSAMIVVMVNKHG